MPYSHSLHAVELGPGPLRRVDDPELARWLALANRADLLAEDVSRAAQRLALLDLGRQARNAGRGIAEGADLIRVVIRDRLQSHGPGAEVACDGHLWRWDAVVGDFASRREETKGGGPAEQ
jgi:hypothetical protein